jgi:YD repeat-containing protein
MRMTEPGSVVTTYTYDAVGNLVREVRGSTTKTYVYDRTIDSRTSPSARPACDTATTPTGTGSGRKTRRRPSIRRTRTTTRIG